MATKRLSMRKTREILRQKWALGRSHREVARSLSDEGVDRYGSIYLSCRLDREEQQLSMPGG